MRIVEATKKYNRPEHLVYACQYHVIFCPKYRRGVLTDAIEIRLQEIFNQVKGKSKHSLLFVRCRKAENATSARAWVSMPPLC